MGAFEKAQLKDKYAWSGKRYRDLMTKVSQENYEKIGTAVLNAGKRRFEKDIKRILPKRDQKTVVIPDVSNIIRRSPTIKKGADRGELLSRSVREDLRKAVKRGLLAQPLTTTQGKIRASAARAVRAELKSYFETRTKKDPRYGMPKNIYSISVTETMSVINPLQFEYMDRVVKENPGFEVEKYWIHNRSRSKEPRSNHEEVHMQRRKLDEKFSIPVYKTQDGNRTRTGTLSASFPHDPRLPAEEVITCHCTVKYVMVVKKTVAKTWRVRYWVFDARDYLQCS